MHLHLPLPSQEKVIQILYVEFRTGCYSATHLVDVNCTYCLRTSCSPMTRLAIGLSQIISQIQCFCQRADAYNSIGVVLLAVAIYAGLYLSIGKPFLPTHGPAWAIIFIWFCAIVMGYVVDRVSFASLAAISTVSYFVQRILLCSDSSAMSD